MAWEMPSVHVAADILSVSQVSCVTFVKQNAMRLPRNCHCVRVQGLAFLSEVHQTIVNG